VDVVLVVVVFVGGAVAVVVGGAVAIVVVVGEMVEINVEVTIIVVVGSAHRSMLLDRSSLEAFDAAHDT